MDFIHKIIAERRAARVSAPETLVGEEAAEAAETDPADGRDDWDAPLAAPEPARAPRALVAPAWTNPNAADLPPLILMPEERMDRPSPAAPAPEPAPEPLFSQPAPAFVAPAPAAPAPDLSAALGWDRPLPLRTAPAQAAPTEQAPALSPAAAAFAGAAQGLRGPADAAAFAAPEPLAPPAPRLDEAQALAARAARRPTGVLNDAGVQMPPPAAGRGALRAGHVKTRMLGFNPETLGMSDPFGAQAQGAETRFPVGWMVVVGGPGLGNAFALRGGVARIGRGEDQEVSLNFGDNAISRENHVSVAYDAEQRAFYIGQSGRSNIARLNGRPLLSTERLASGDQIRIGETTLRFAAFCGEDFAWSEQV